MVVQRLQRQQTLERKDPPRILLVCDEAAVRRPIGGTKAFTEQLRRLEEIAQRPNVIVQVVPSTTAAYAGLVSLFTVMSFDDRPDVAYVEGPDTGQLIGVELAVVSEGVGAGDDA
ncbi:DUF5753 domain-containing protein [Actinoallomurus sp. WRP6H-15]|nr:DUF5753 domain-containing protein [Actinoallomurus soli]